MHGSILLGPESLDPEHKANPHGCPGSGPWWNANDPSGPHIVVMCFVCVCMPLGYLPLFPQPVIFLGEVSKGYIIGFLPLMLSQFLPHFTLLILVLSIAKESFLGVSCPLSYRKTQST